MGSLAVVTSLVLAFVIALTTGGLWVKTHTYVTQPAVRFKYDMVLAGPAARPSRPLSFPPHLRASTAVGALRELWPHTAAPLNSQPQLPAVLEGAQVRVRRERVYGPVCR